jgi:low affinity Fe/Cu permease
VGSVSSLEEYKPRNWELVVCVVLFALWTIPAVLLDKPAVRVLGVPVLWFYYITLSVATSLVITLMYLVEERWRL